MKPVNINAQDILGDMAAYSQIAFGAAVMRYAAGTVKSTRDLTDANILGIAADDMVEKTVDGFYSAYDAVPIITGGRARVWITPNHTTAEDVVAGDYLEIADIGGTNVLPVGAFQTMDAESGTKTADVRQVETLARALEDVDLLDIEPVASDVAVGATEITMSSANMTNLDLADGDYILMEDISGQCMINRVASTTSTVITLQLASTVALASGDSDPVHKLAQVEAILI
ncbi:MAG: hypothetical protein C5617_009110 [ANME-2 cluster archaeon]|jgi:hypothetical protein|nr:MAG: hypothetical protein C5617_009110 [ANME-2 cluster archaeon]